MKKDTKKTANGAALKKPRKRWSARGKSIQKGRLKALKDRIEELEGEKKKLKEISDGARRTVFDQNNQIEVYARERSRRVIEEKKLAVASALTYILWEAFEEIGVNDTKLVIEARLREYEARPGAGSVIENPVSGVRVF